VKEPGAISCRPTRARGAASRRHLPHLGVSLGRGVDPDPHPAKSTTAAMRRAACHAVKSRAFTVAARRERRSAARHLSLGLRQTPGRESRTEVARGTARVDGWQPAASRWRNTRSPGAASGHASCAARPGKRVGRTAPGATPIPPNLAQCVTMARRHARALWWEGGCRGRDSDQADRRGAGPRHRAG
jgi:hypothetical protein